MQLFCKLQRQARTHAVLVVIGSEKGVVLIVLDYVKSTLISMHVVTVSYSRST
jgi:hypothetical protein